MNQTQNKLGKISIECIMNSSNNNGLDTMKVTSLEIKDMGGIPYLGIDNLNPNMNIICGENGVGKTNILDSLAYLFTNWSENQLKKRFGSNFGEAKATVYLEHKILDTNYGSSFILSSSISDFEPISNKVYKTVELQYLKQLIYFRTNRDIQYKHQKAIESDPDSQKYAQDLISGTSSENLKTWFVGRFYQDAAKNLETEFVSNFSLAKSLFKELNREYSFKTINRKNEIMVLTPTGEIYLEYLSSGFKSCLYILMGIIKEIEYRFQEQILEATDFDGIILIDEIELHLHPEWQGRICKILKDNFPKAQFFITTHSPHVVQTAGKDEVIALQRIDDNVIKRDLPTSEYGYQGWTIEEILKDVMGMKGTRSEEYNEIREKFLNAFRKKDKPKAQEAFDKLQEMLHPSNELKVIFQMQLDSLGE